MEKTEYFDFYGVRIEVNGYFKSGTGGDNPDEVEVYAAHAIGEDGRDFVEVTEWLERWPEFLEACEEALSC